MKQDESNINENYWSDIFPFEPYPNQQQGINESINTLNSGGIHLLEGPCGTGKTLISLTACLSLVRDPSTKFERILVTTSKKQQLAAFEDDLKTIIDILPALKGEDSRALGYYGSQPTCSLGWNDPEVWLNR